MASWTKQDKLGWKSDDGFGYETALLASAQPVGQIAVVRYSEDGETRLARWQCVQKPDGTRQWRSNIDYSPTPGTTYQDGFAASDFQLGDSVTMLR